MDGLSRLCLPLAAIAAVCSGLMSCTDQQSATAVTASQPSTEVTKQAMSDTNKTMDIAAQVSIARQDLARRLEIDPDEIALESARHVNWRSGAAGCPQPGMSYTMAIVPGVLILLRANGEFYRYHGGRNRPPSYCPAERAEAPAMGQGEEVM